MLTGYSKYRVFNCTQNHTKYKWFKIESQKFGGMF